MKEDGDRKKYYSNFNIAEGCNIMRFLNIPITNVDLLIVIFFIVFRIFFKIIKSRSFTIMIAPIKIFQDKKIGFVVEADLIVMKRMV